MKNHLFLAFLLTFSTTVYSQTYLLEEYFSDPLNFPCTWTTIDKDGDGYNWHISTSAAEGYAVSDSWKSGVVGALTPENYLISPKISLTGLSGSVKLRYTIQIADPFSVEEHYKVAVSTSGNKVTDFKDIVMEETCTEADYYENLPEWKERVVDLTPYIGQNIYLTWCHFNCTNMYKLLLDSIQVSYATDVNVINHEQVYNIVYPNPAKDELLVSGSFVNAQIQLFTIDGRLVYHSAKETKQVPINVSCFENGVYILKINSDKGIVARKVYILN